MKCFGQISAKSWDGGPKFAKKNDWETGGRRSGALESVAKKKRKGTHEVEKRGEKRKTVPWQKPEKNCFANPSSRIQLVTREGIRSQLKNPARGKSNKGKMRDTGITQFSAAEGTGYGRLVKTHMKKAKVQNVS